MNKNKLRTVFLSSGLVLGAVMAAFSVVQESNLSNYDWAAKIEESVNVIAINFCIIIIPN